MGGKRFRGNLLAGLAKGVVLASGKRHAAAADAVQGNIALMCAGVERVGASSECGRTSITGGRGRRGAHEREEPAKVVELGDAKRLGADDERAARDSANLRHAPPTQPRAAQPFLDTFSDERALCSLRWHRARPNENSRAAKQPVRVPTRSRTLLPQSVCTLRNRKRRRPRPAPPRLTGRAIARACAPARQRRSDRTVPWPPSDSSASWCTAKRARPRASLRHATQAARVGNTKRPVAHLRVRGSW
eukprot:5102068-Pleurochrysis_carterae.AAC.5